MMNHPKRYSLLLAIFLLLPLTTYTQSNQTVGKNIELLLQQILESQHQMQADILALQTKLEKKDQEIKALQQALQQQQQTVKKQAQQVAQQSQAIEKQAAKTTVAGTDFYSARLQYQVARSLLHDTIFDVRKGEQRPWLERVILEFRKVVDNHPQAPEAPESQLRIAMIYRRYLDNYPQAKIEYQKILDDFPDSSAVEEAKKALRGL